MAVTTTVLLERCSFLCARPIEAFGDLTPMEVEALLREAVDALERKDKALAAMTHTRRANREPMRAGD